MTIFELAAKLTLDSSEYEHGLKLSASSANKFAKSMDKGVNRLLKAGTVAAGAAGAALVAMGKDAVKVGMQFDASMSQVAATMGTTVEEIGELRDFAQKMGATTVFSANQAAEALNYMALAGYDANKSMEMLPTVLNLAAAGNFDLARASDMVTDAESALGLTSKEAAAMVDEMAMTASKSNTSVEQLGEAMLTIGGTAQFMAGGTDRLSTVLGILADNGIKGSEAGTHLRNMLLKLSAPTADGEKVIKQLGLEIFDTSGNMRDMQDIILDLNAAMDGMTDEAKIKAISDLFNARDVAAVNALLGTSVDRWNELGGSIANASGAAEKMAETQLDNLAGDVTLLKSAAEGAKIAFSDGLSPALRSVVKMLTRKISSESFQASLTAIGKKVGEVATQMANWTSNALPKVMKLFEDGGKKIKVFGGILAGVLFTIKAVANPIGALATALGALAGATVISALGVEDFDAKLRELNETQEEAIKKSKSQAESYEEIVRSTDEAIEAVEKQTENDKALWKELQSIVDENGRVIEGNESRASQIVGELNSSIGSELELENGLISNYQEQQSEIENLIQKKRALHMLDAIEQKASGAEETLASVRGEIGSYEVKRAELGAQAAERQSEIDQLNEAIEESLANAELTTQELINQRDAAQAQLDSIMSADAEYAEKIDSAVERENEAIQDLALLDEAYRLNAEENYEALSDLLANDTKNRIRHKIETKRITKEEIDDLAVSYESAKTAAERYAAELAAGTAGYTKEGYDALISQAKDYRDLLAEAASASGDALVQALVDAILGGTGNVSSAASSLFGSAINALGGGGIGGHRHGVSSNAIGNDYVPYNNYPALLHRGEAVLTAREADEWRRGKGSGGNGVTNVFNFHGVAQSDLDYIVAYVNRGLA